MHLIGLSGKVSEILLMGMAVLLLFTGRSCQRLEEEAIFQLSIDRMEYVSEGSYLLKGSLVCLGNQMITREGICWSESGEPDLDCSLVELDPPFSTGEFSLTVSGLSGSTSYYFRAFALCNETVFYSETKEFVTRPDSGNMVMDVDGNIYKVVKIGDQTWMAENLKVTRYPDKSKIPLSEDEMEWFHHTRESQAYCWHGNVLTHGYVFGGLYTWAAATAAYDGIKLIEEGVQGVCPDGWHLPSDAEWKRLEMHLGMRQDEAEDWKWRGTDQGGKLKQEGLEYWLGPNAGATDDHGFTALPGGYRHGSGQFKELSVSARFWTSTSNGYSYAWYREIDYDTAAIYRDFAGVYRGHSVRCVKDE